MIGIVALITIGCHSSRLKCWSEFLYPEYLASEKVNTPDPKRKCFFGQQVIVYWNLPHHACENLIELHLNLRYGNREMETVAIQIEKERGFWRYQLINDDYWCRGGIISYQALLYQNGECVDYWNHSLWATIIEIGDQEE